MENIAEYPLLFVEDYEHFHQDIIDNTNHETSIDSRNDDDDVDTDPAGIQHQDLDLPPAKRRDRRPSDRQGVG